MIKEPFIKVGLISCSGEELSNGLLSRLATLQVLEELRPKNTVTICLPLFLAGDEKERNFAKLHPSITIDGCEKQCAFRATSLLSAKPVKSIIISNILKAYDVSSPDSCRILDNESLKMKSIIANLIASEIDKILVNYSPMDQIVEILPLKDKKGDNL